MVSPFLYEDILIEIFLRLPAKSVGKFRCLSKTWRTNLSTSKFINLHLTTQKGKQPKLFLQKQDASLYVITPPIKVNTVSSKVELRTSSEVVGSCNGLVLLLDIFENFLLVNPITLQHVKIQIPRFHFNSKTLFSYKYGFGYDSCSDDYKIVMYYWRGADDGSTYVQVYSVKSNVWKRVNTSPQHRIIRGSYTGGFTNGAIHWVSYNRNCPSLIVAFNLADEIFYDFPSPVSAIDWKVPFYSVHVLEGCLCVVDSSCNDIWIMKEYGVEASWTKVNVGSSRIYKPMCFIGNEEIVLLTDGGDRIIVYNLVEGAAKDIVVDGDTTSYFDGVTFFDSLVSPDQHV